MGLAPCRESCGAEEAKSPTKKDLAKARKAALDESLASGKSAENGTTSSSSPRRKGEAHNSHNDTHNSHNDTQASDHSGRGARPNPYPLASQLRDGAYEEEAPFFSRGESQDGVPISAEEQARFSR